MTLDQLQVVDTVVKSGSFSSAAKILRRAQSAVSYAVKNLEEEWGIEIFDRSSYRAELTPTGEALLAKMRAVLSSAESLEQYGRSLSSAVEPVIRLSISSLFPMQIFTAHLTRFKEKFPTTQLKISVEQMKTPANRLQAGEVDLAVTLPGVASSGIENGDGYDIELVGVAAPDYFSCGDPSYFDLQKGTQIVVSIASDPDKETSGGIIEGADKWTVADHSTKRDLIISGLGFGYLTLYMVEEDLRSGRLVELKSMKRHSVPMVIQRKVTDPFGPAKKFIWEHAFDIESST